MFELMSLMFGWTLVIAALGGFVLQCDKKGQRAKKRSVKSAKSAKQSAKRAAKKGTQAVKEGAEFAKEKTKETAESAKRKVKSAVEPAKATKSKRSRPSSRISSRSSSRRSSLADAKPAGAMDQLAAKAKSAKETVKQKLEPRKETKERAQSLKSQIAQKVEDVSHKVLPKTRDPMDASHLQKEVQLEPRELHFETEGGIQKVHILNSGPHRQALKVKCSDNQLYRVSPVYAFLDPGISLSFDVQRLKNEKVKLDQLVFLVAEAGHEKNDPKAVFKSLGTDKAAALVLALKV